jgi:hypothetical protein
LPKIGALQKNKSLSILWGLSALGIVSGKFLSEAKDQAPKPRRVPAGSSITPARAGAGEPL